MRLRVTCHRARKSGSLIAKKGRSAVLFYWPPDEWGLAELSHLREIDTTHSIRATNEKHIRFLTRK